MNIKTLLQTTFVCLAGLGVTSVSVADANFVLPNPNMGEAGIWFAYQNDPTHAYASLTFDSSTADLGGTMYGRAEIYRFRPMGVEAARLTLDSSALGGYVEKPGGGKWGSLSDFSVKKDIHAFTLGLNELEKVMPYKFKYNGVSKLGPDNGAETIGLIAQEIQPVLPMMVHEIPGETIDGTPALAMDTSPLTYVLINAVKQQAATIRQLDKEARDLEQLACKRYRNLSPCKLDRH